ncbi:MAG: rhomboid family intramembrane serine protease [Bacteriovoracaceae bacterium]
MELKTKIKANWFTQSPSKRAMVLSLGLVLILLISTVIFLGDFFQGGQWMSASPFQVFQQKEYWRLWTALFAHGDMIHVFSNLILFFPLAYSLSSYFSPYFFPLFGFFVGGIINLITLSFMPDMTSLVGVSGVVHWMGASWLTLSLLIDRRQSTFRRILKLVGISLILFIPDTYKPETSYMSHFLGYTFGIISGFLFFGFKKRQFLSAERLEYVIEDYWEALPEEYDLDQTHGNEDLKKCQNCH